MAVLSQSSQFAIIGNRNSSAVISASGVIEWCCLPYLDSPSHFASWIDKERGGNFQLLPHGDFRTHQRYIPNTNILETLFETPQGKATLTDWMPIQNEWFSVPALCRRIEVQDGFIDWLLTCTPRFHYGTDQAQAEKHSRGVLFRGSQMDDIATLYSNIPIEISANGLAAISKFTLKQKQMAQFTWIWGRHPLQGENLFNLAFSRSSYENLQDAGTKEMGCIGPSVQPTIEYWKKNAHSCLGSCIFSGPWHDAVARSQLLVKLMNTPYAGSISQGICASSSGAGPGSRTWGHRYATIRGSALNLQALANLGCLQEAQSHFEWLKSIVERDGAESLQPLYTLDGGKAAKEREIPFMTRHERVHQFQLDIYGHVILTGNEYFKIFGHLPDTFWTRLTELCDYICHAWKRPDHGPWGTTVKPEHFVVSKLFCWAALDRACVLSHALGKPTPPRWVREKGVIHRVICEQGFDSDKNSFVRSFGSNDIDASSLWIPLLNFLPIDDPRVQGTLSTIRLELSEGSFLRNFQTSIQMIRRDSIDLCSSFLFISCLAIAGFTDEASDRLAEACTYANSLGLFADPASFPIRNGFDEFPSSAVHLALINAALYVGNARGHQKPAYPLLGEPLSISAKSA